MHARKYGQVCVENSKVRKAKEEVEAIYKLIFVMSWVSECLMWNCREHCWCENKQNNWGERKCVEIVLNVTQRNWWREMLKSVR